MRVRDSFLRRGEAGGYSDFDLFIVSHGTRKDPALSRLDEILVKASLIETTKKHGLPEFSGDGQYLVGHTLTDFISTLVRRKMMLKTLLPLASYSCSRVFRS